MNDKSTHLGECQICGSQQCLPNGKLAKHGYNVEYGFFSGVCCGSGYLPFEQEKRILENVVISIRADADRMSKYISMMQDEALRDQFSSHIARYLRVLARENNSKRDWLRFQGERLAKWCIRPLTARVAVEEVKAAKAGVRKAASKLNDDIYRAKRSFEKLLDEKNRVLLNIRGSDFEGMGKNEAWMNFYYAHPTSNRGASLPKFLAAFEAAYGKYQVLTDLVASAVAASELVVTLKSQKA